jgi:hypothetical protein
MSIASYRHGVPSSASIIVAGVASLAAPAAVWGQATPATQTAGAPQSATPAVPDTDYAPPSPTVPARIPATGFLMPDLPDAAKDYT